METQTTTNQYQLSTDILGRFMSQTYAWMTYALLLTSIVAGYIAISPGALRFLGSNSAIFWIIFGLELALVWYISARINKLSVTNAIILFSVYSLLNGVFLGVFISLFDISTVASAFAITAGTFAVMSIYGYTTKADLTRIGNIAFMGLIGIIIGSVVNIFLQSEGFSWFMTYAGVLVFVALIAYDTQKLKRYAIIAQETGKVANYAIIGALALYLDFINLFIRILSILGSRD